VKRRSSTLPLGIDVGRRRIRIALAEARSDTRPRLLAVAARDHDGDPFDALRAALAELQTSERRCVLGLGAPDAALRLVRFPSMPSWERARAARFEATRSIDYAVRDAAISLVALPEHGAWMLGIARRTALAATIDAARRLHLRATAVDDVSLALHRAHPSAGCIVDVGSEMTRVMTFDQPAPATMRVPIGGDHLTGAIARSLGIDAHAAERRKRTHGCGGAGEAEYDTLVASIAEAFLARSATGALTRNAIVMCGNGARLPELEAGLRDATGAEVKLAELPPDVSETLPPDVLRAAGPDWSTAYGLSLWGVAS
jgi:Tfp pilus assembly PilM family ATPase